MKRARDNKSNEDRGGDSVTSGHVAQGTRPRTDSTWTTKNAVLSTNRPVYRTKTVRDKFLKTEEKSRTWKDKARRMIKNKCVCNDKKKWKSCLSSLFPFVKILQKYQWRSDLPNDIVSGLTVGIMQLPQGMAYAMLADLPPVVGLYMSFFPVIVYFFFGTSKQISMGTVAVVSLMTGGIVASQTSKWWEEQGLSEAVTSGNMTKEMSHSEMEFKIAIAATVSFITGLSQVAMGLLHVGFVTTYMGDSLVSGFTTGAAVHVFTSQVKYVFGLKIKRFPNTFQIINTYAAIIEKLPQTNVPTLIMSVICMIILYLVKVQINQRFKTKLKMPVPIELIVVVAATLASHYGGFHERWNVKVVGEIPAGLPEPKMPTFRNVSQYGIDCIIIGIVAFAQSVSLAVLMAKKHHYEIDSNKEMIGYGMGTFFGSFFSCYPIAASVSRSSVQDSAGGRTQVASLVSATLVLVVILFIGPMFENLPNCALSAIIMVALRSMFLQILELKQLFKVSPFDCAIWLVTFLCVVILHVDMGLVIGIVFAIFTVVIRSQTTKVVTLERLSETNEYKNVAEFSKTEPNSRIHIVSYNTALYYANSELFIKHVHRVTRIKPEKMRKVLKKMMTLSDPLHQDKTKLPDSKIVEMETVTPHVPASSSNGESTMNIPSNHRSSVIGPAPNLDPRPFLYLIIDCAAFTFIDPVGIKILKQLIEDYKTIGVNTFLGGVRDNVFETMEKAGFVKSYEKIIFLTVRDAVLAAEEHKQEFVHSFSNLDPLNTEFTIEPTEPLIEEVSSEEGSNSVKSGVDGLSNSWIRSGEFQ